MVRFEFSQDGENWVSTINNVDVHDYILVDNYRIIEGFNLGDTPLTNSLTFEIVSDFTVRKEFLKFLYARAYRDNSENPSFTGYLSQDHSSKIEMVDLSSYEMTYYDFSNFLDNLKFSQDKEWIDTDWDFYNPNNEEKSLIHYLVSDLLKQSKISLTIVDKVGKNIGSKVNHFNISVEDDAWDRIYSIMREQGLWYYIKNNNFIIFDVIPSQDTGKEIRDIEVDAEIKHNTIEITKIPNIEIIEYKVDRGTSNQFLEWWPYSWFKGSSSKDVDVRDTNFFKYLDSYAYITNIDNFSADTSGSSGKCNVDVTAAQWVGHERSDKNDNSTWASFAKDVNTPIPTEYITNSRGSLAYEDARLRIYFSWHNNGLNVMKIKFSADITYKNVLKVLSGESGEDTEPISPETIYTENDAKRYFVSQKMIRSQEQEEWIFYFKESLNVGDIVRISDIPESTLRIWEKEDTDDPFGGYVYHAYPYDSEVSEWTLLDPKPLPSQDTTPRLYPVTITPEDALIINDNTFQKATIRYWINCDNPEGAPEAFLDGTSIEVKQDVPAEATNPSDWSSYSSKYYFDYTFTNISRDLYTFKVVWGEATTTRTVEVTRIEPAKSLTLSSTSPSFYYTKEGIPHDNQSIVVSVNKQNINDPVKWEVPGKNIPNDTLSYTFTPDDVDSYRRIIIKVSAGDYEATLTIGAVYDGGSGTFLSLDIDRTLIDYYADDYIVDDSAINIDAESDMDITLTIDGITVISPGPSLQYSIKPSGLFENKESAKVVATTTKMKQSYTISKNKLKGTLTIVPDKASIQYYADNIPHSSEDKIILSVTSTNYKTFPELYLDNVKQTTPESSSYSFNLSQETFASKNSINAEVRIGEDKASTNLVKLLDVGSISLSANRESFTFYADDVPHNSSEISTVTISQQGYSKLPTLEVNQVIKEITEETINKGSYVVKSSDLIGVNSLNLRLYNDLESTTLNINKHLDTPSITITLSEGVVEYYYDNVAITPNINVTVGYEGLFYLPVLEAGETPITLDTEGKGTIPVTLFDEVDSSLTITAKAQRNISYITSRVLTKIKRPLILSMGLSGAQFSYTSTGAVSPESITISNDTSGLSSNSKVVLVVGGEVKSWNSENKYIITPDMVVGNYLVVSVGYGGESTSTIITKTYDGKSEIIEYSKSKSFTIYPDDEYTFTYNNEGVTYNGETMAWIVPWSEVQPDISSNEYLWRRSRTSEDEEWQYTRLTGIQGDPGADAGGMYLGHFTSAPLSRPDGSSVQKGDYYLDTSEVGSPKPYKYNGSQWILITSEDPEWSVVASATMNDVNNYGGSLLSTSAYYGFFQLLSAQQAFIKNLGAQDIVLNSGGTIKSENYDSSDGAEGFKIDSDGNVDFNNGTWRGSFANGMSFIPPTKFHITRQMKHKDVWKMMQKAGIVSGIYDAGSSWESYSSKGDKVDGIAFTEQPPAFCCMDYDEDKVNASIPVVIGNDVLTAKYNGTSVQIMNTLFGPCFNIWPMSFDSYLMLMGTSDEASTPNITVDGFYILTKTKLEEYVQTENIEEGQDFASMKIKYLVKQTSMDASNLYVALSSSRTYVAAYSYYDKDSETFYMLADDNSTNKVKVYRFTSGDTSMSYEGEVSVAEKPYSQISQWILPFGSIHKINGKYQTFMGAATSSDFASGEFGIYESSDMLNWTKVIQVNLQTLKPSDATGVFARDMITINSRTFLIVTFLYPSKTTVGFYELVNGSLVNIPSGLILTSTSSPKYGTNLYIKDNIIYGSLSCTLFKYDLNTNIFTDMTRDVLKNIDISILTRSGLPVSAADRYQRINSYLEGVIVYNDTAGHKYSAPLMETSSIMNLDWDYSTNSLLISCWTDAMQIFCTPLYYNPETNTYKMFTLNIQGILAPANIFTSYTIISNSTESLFFDISTFSLVFKGVSFNKYQVTHINYTPNNIIFNDSLSNQLLNIPYYHRYLYMNLNFLWSIVNNLALGVDPPNIISNIILHPEDPMVLIDSDSIKVNSMFPIYDCRRILIREFADRYEVNLIHVGNSESDYNVYGYTAQVTASGQNCFACAQVAKGLLKSKGRSTMISITSPNIVPFITIYKDSEEYIPAEIFWDFPAQFTVDESIQRSVHNGIIQMPIPNAAHIS